MSKINKDGILIDPKVITKRIHMIEHGGLKDIHAIVIHQTDSSSAESTFNSYTNGSGNGAHFLIDRNGIIYQTASLKSRCFHIGKRIKSKCLEIHGKNCADVQIVKALTLRWTAQLPAIDAIERNKNYPDRFPINSDSIGIELVGLSLDDTKYETVSQMQTNSLQWLIDQLYTHFKLSKNDVFRHPDISYKNPGEARSAIWK